VGFASVLYDPAPEFFFCDPHQPFKSIISQLETVEYKVKGDSQFKIVKNGRELRQTIDEKKKLPIFHCIEGGFAIENPANVRELADRGVAYVTLAHLLFKGVSSNVNGFPCISQADYTGLFAQPSPGIGLTKPGQDLCRALFDSRIIADVTHMSEQAIADTMALARSHSSKPPVIASHTAVRHKDDYLLNLSPDLIKEVVSTGGLVGVILFNYWLANGRDPKTIGINDYLDQIEEIIHITSADNVAVGSDLDGFIEPIHGVENFDKFGVLAQAVKNRFGEKVGEKILVGNAVRVFEQGWG
jgi:microsomal dipeptidase-like Zn-dependent dipeptidase